MSGFNDTPPKKRRWPLSRKWTIITVVLLLVVVFYAVVIMLHKPQGGNSQDQTTLYINRPGFTHTDGVGDPLGLASKSAGQVVQYGGQNVVQACALLSVEDVRAAGFKIDPDQLTTSVTQTFFDGVGPAPYASDSVESSFYLPDPDITNNCEYHLMNREYAQVIVYQPNYIKMNVVASEISRTSTPLPDMGSVKVFQNTKAPSGIPNDNDYYLQAPTATASVRFETADSTSRDKALKSIAAHLEQAAATPTPARVFTFNSPIFTGSTLDPCTLNDNVLFKAIQGQDSGPLVKQWVSTVVGVDDIGGKSYNVVANDCDRRSSSYSVITSKSVRVATQTFETEEGAKAEYYFERNTSPTTSNAKDITPTIGDQSFYADSTASEDNTLVIRKGRAILHINYYVPGTDKQLSADQRIKVMTDPVRTMIETKLKDFK